jgi:hypothetical protein
MSDKIVEDTWRQQNEWSTTAGRFKSEIWLWRKLVLLLSIGGAIFATLSTQVPDGNAQKVVAVIAAVLLAIIPVVTPKKLSPQKTRNWAVARSVSEGLKEELYLFLARAEPYADPDGAKPEILRDRSFEITRKASDLLQHVTRVEAPPRELPTFKSPKEYLEIRVADQIDWYQEKSRLHSDKAAGLRNMEFCLAIVAALLAAVTGAVGGVLKIQGWPIEIGAWVAVLTTIGGTLTAHIAAARYDHIVTSYSATAFQLRHLKNHWPPGGDDSIPSVEWSTLVRRCEDAISKENESWLAKWVTEDK